MDCREFGWFDVLEHVRGCGPRGLPLDEHLLARSAELLGAVVTGMALRFVYLPGFPLSAFELLRLGEQPPNRNGTMTKDGLVRRESVLGKIQPSE